VGQVCRGIAGLEGGGRATAGEGKAEQRHRKDSHGGAGDDHERPEDADRVGKDQSRPPAAGVHQAGDGDRDQGGTNDRGRRRDTGELLGGEIGREQGTDSRTCGNTDSAQDLGTSEDGDDATLGVDGFKGIDDGTAGDSHGGVDSIANPGQP